MSRRYATALFFAVTGLLCTTDGSDLGMLSAAWSLGVAAVLVIIECVKRGPGDTGLLVLVTAFFVLTFSINGTMLYFLPSSANPMLPEDPETLCFSMQVGGLGWLMLVLGYRGMSRYLASSKRSEWKKRVPDFAWTRLAVTGTLGVPLRFFIQLYFFSEEGEATFSSVGQIPSAIATMAMICTIALTTAPWRAYRVWAMGLIAAYSMAGLFSGQRSEALIPWLVLALSRLLRPRTSQGLRNWRKPLIGLAILGAVLIVVFPFQTSFKMAITKVRNQTTGLARMEEGLRMWGEILTESSAQESIDEEDGGGALVKIITRYSHLQYGSQLITKGVAQWGYLQGQSLLEAFIAFIPRLVWPEKPEIGLGPSAYKLMGYKDNGSATVPIAADWYLNFAMPGVVVGMMLTGAYYAVITYALRREDPLSMALLASLSYDLMQSGQGIANALAQVIIRVVVVWAVRPLVIYRPDPVEAATNAQEQPSPDRPVGY
jgi:hypothetical protein